jgi:hypothetical protein
MAIGFLVNGDAPQFSRTLYSWPKYARVGALFIGAGGGIRRTSKFDVLARDRDRIDRNAMLMRDDNDLIDIIAFMLENNILD